MVGALAKLLKESHLMVCNQVRSQDSMMEIQGDWLVAFG